MFLTSPLLTRAGAGSPTLLSYAQLPFNPSDQQDYDTEPYIAVDPANVQHIVVGFMRRVSNVDLAAVQCWVATSFDGGATWPVSQMSELTQSDTELNCADMSIAFGPNGNVYATRVQYVGNDVGKVYMHTSSDGGSTWSPATVVVDATSDGLGVDRPWVLVDSSTTSAYKGSVYVVAKTAFFDYLNPHVYFARSVDGGHTWSSAAQLDNVGSLNPSANYPGYTTLIETATLGPDGAIMVGYKSRCGNSSNNTGGTPCSVNNNGTCSSYCYTAAISTDGGKTFALRPMPNPAYPSGVTDPDETAPVVVTADPNGAGHFAAEWLSGGFVSGSSEVDVAVATTTDYGRTWSTPVKINAPSAVASIQDHPWIQWAANGVLYASWRDRRNDTSQSSTANFDLYCAYSTDGGQTWSDNLQLNQIGGKGAASPAAAQEAGDDFIGEGVASDGSAWTGWAILNSSVRQVWLAHWTLPSTPPALPDMSRTSAFLIAGSGVAALVTWRRRRGGGAHLASMPSPGVEPGRRLPSSGF